MPQPMFLLKESIVLYFHQDYTEASKLRQ